MKLEYRLLTNSELESSLRDLAGWAVENGMLTRRFEFKTYKDGLVFAVAVGYLADKLDHHPDLAVGYTKVTVAMNTHSVKGLSPYDIELASCIDAII